VRSGSRLLKTAAASIAALLLLVASGRAAEPLRYDKGYITSDTTWSGTVILRGQAVVKRGCTLTILPGTVVKFEWVDEDGDDIGDGELTVEGRLVARGTKENVIVFTSARENPRMKDWTYVQVSVNRDAVLEYCRFEYAFSGVQVHYSTAVIRNCLFRNNFEGIRFSTTDVRIENNDIVDNYYGVRCEAHGSRTVITRNRFSGNEFAFFPVQKNWDSVKIYENNFEGSRGYDVKFGMNQKQDMDFTRNWWGTADPKEIEGKVYDKSKEEALGRVRFVPFLTERVAGCGIL
jgi:parallel beta-helix repeat protein